VPWSLTGSAGRASESRRAFLLAVVVAGLIGFGALALAYSHEPVARYDQGVARWVADDLPSWVQSSARPYSWLGGWIGLTILGVVAFAVLVRERAWLDLGFFLATFLGVQLVVALLKDAFDRSRPHVGSAVPLPTSPAFPSGHATAGAASLGALAVLASERLPSRRARVWLWSLTVLLGLAVGLSRIALDVHYATDVLAGWCLGLAWLAGCLLVRDGLRARARLAQ
jgi:membrane-associated phospholipid phosphatase